MVIISTKGTAHTVTVSLRRCWFRGGVPRFCVLGSYSGSHRRCWCKARDSDRHHRPRTKQVWETLDSVVQGCSGGSSAHVVGDDAVALLCEEVTARHIPALGFRP